MIAIEENTPTYVEPIVAITTPVLHSNARKVTEEIPTNLIQTARQTAANPTFVNYQATFQPRSRNYKLNPRRVRRLADITTEIRDEAAPEKWGYERVKRQLLQESAKEGDESEIFIPTNLEKLKVVQLRDILKGLGLKTSGRKIELIERINQHRP